MDYLISVIMVNYNSSEFIELALYSLEKLTKNKYKVFMCDNGSDSKDQKNLQRIVSKYPNVDLFFRQQSQFGSMGHGEALNILIEKVDTRYTVILDADATFLIKNWDEILLSELNTDTKIIGTQPVPGSKKPSDFPLMFALLFETKVFKKLNIDMRPKEIAIGQDTGWEMREKFLKANFKSKLLYFRNTRTFKDGPFRDVLCAEFYHQNFGQIFASHFGRGSTLGVNKFREENKLLKLLGIEELFKRIRGYWEKRIWLAICRDIIDREAVC